jgi:hypothetical protein
MKIKFIAPASDFASTKYTPSQRPLHHFCCECARAQHYDSLTGWTLCACPLASQMQLLRKYTLYTVWQVTKLHARAAVLTGLNLFLVQFHHAFFICMRALLSSRQVQTCSVVLM